MSRLNDLLRQLRLKDPALAADLQREVDALADRRAFGLNFERHVPEAVELPGRRVRRGDKVRILPPRGIMPTSADQRLWRVLGVSSSEASLEAMDGDDPRDTASSSVDELVVVAEFRDPIYPGLVSTDRVDRGGDKPFHAVINAENYHALQTLLFTHRGKLDCIYIDPPYNTGNESWIYNDRYVAADDHYKHSKWLAFMERRLLLAKQLLSITGVIVVAIGDEEHHHLRMLMDQIFDESNFLVDASWQGNVKNDSRFGGGGLDYMLVYANSRQALLESDTRWLEPKPDVDSVFVAAMQAWVESGQDRQGASRAFKRWWASIPKGSAVLASKHYSYVDDVRAGEPYFASPLMSPNFRKNLVYDFYHPYSRRPFRTPKNGWRYSEDSMQRLVEDGGVHFGPDEATLPMKKVYLRDVSVQVPVPSFRADRRAGGKQLEAAIGPTDFPFPKNVEVLAKWIGIVTSLNPHALIADFFAGSGTTAEAVMRLNSEDDGSRRCILVTNNEVSSKDARQLSKAGHRPGDPEWEGRGVHERVAKPRISTIASGERPDGSPYEDSAPANVEFFALTYEAPLRVASHREFERIAPLLWLRAGSFGRRIDNIEVGWDVAEAYGVLADLDQVDAFLHALKGQETATMAFVVTNEDRLFESVCRDLPDHVEPVRLYESYLRNFEIEAGRGSR